MKFSKSILYILIFQLILLLLISCNSSTNKMSVEHRDEVILKVQGIPIEYIFYYSSLETAKSQQNLVVDSELDSFTTQMLELRKKYKPETIAFADLLSQYVMVAEAKKRGITVSEQEVQELISRAKNHYSKGGFPREAQDFIETIGEDYYWETFSPKGYERGYYISRLREMMILEENDWTLTHITQVKEAEIEIISTDLFDHLIIDEAIEYLDEYYELVKTWGFQ